MKAANLWHNMKLQASQQAGSSVGSRCFHRAAVPLLSDKLFVVSLHAKNQREFSFHPNPRKEKCYALYVAHFGYYFW